MARFLIYTVALDLEGGRGTRAMAKLLVSSLQRTVFDGDIFVFKNSPIPLFSIPRSGLHEIQIEAPPWHGEEGATECLQESLEWRFKARHHLPFKDYERIIYLDADCLALRNLDHLFESDAPVQIQTEKSRGISDEVFNGYLSDTELQSLTVDGINAGTLSIRSDYFEEFTERWEEVYRQEPTQHSRFRDQTALNRLLLDSQLKKERFERDEIAFPFHLDPNYLSYSRAALLHFVGGTQQQKISLAFALFMDKFYRDESSLYLDFLEP